MALKSTVARMDRIENLIDKLETGNQIRDRGTELLDAIESKLAAKKKLSRNELQWLIEQISLLKCKLSFARDAFYSVAKRSKDNALALDMENQNDS